MPKTIAKRGSGDSSTTHGLNPARIHNDASQPNFHPRDLSLGRGENLDPGLLLLGLLTGLPASVIPFTCEFLALKRLSSQTFSILVALEPVIASIVGALLLGEQMRPLAVAFVLLASVGTCFKPQECITQDGMTTLSESNSIQADPEQSLHAQPGTTQSRG